MTTALDPSIWLIVLNFSAGISVTIAPTDSPQGYADERTCRRDVPAVLRVWKAKELPEPAWVRCKQLEIKK